MFVTKDEIVKKFVDHVIESGEREPLISWYVGHTNNLERRKKEHENGKGITCKHFKSLLQCPDVQNACKAENILEKVGFSKTAKDLVIVNESDDVEIVSYSAIGSELHHVYTYLAVENK